MHARARTRTHYLPSSKLATIQSIINKCCNRGHTQPMQCNQAPYIGKYCPSPMTLSGFTTTNTAAPSAFAWPQVGERVRRLGRTTASLAGQHVLQIVNQLLQCCFRRNVRVYAQPTREQERTMHACTHRYALRCIEVQISFPPLAARGRCACGHVHAGVHASRCGCCQY